MSKSDLFVLGQPVSVDNPLPISGGSGGGTNNNGLTDTQLRASAVPVSGPLTDTQLRATEVPVADSVQRTAIGAPADTSAASDTASGSVIAFLKRIAANITTVATRLTLGQSTMANSLRVAVASDQTAIKGALDATAVTGGVLGFKVLSAATTNATSVKTTAGRVYSCQFHNTANAYRYVKFYNLATAPTVGTSTVMSIVGVPPGGRASLTSTQGIYCSAGIAYAITAGVADNDTTAVGANEVGGSITYL